MYVLLYSNISFLRDKNINIYYLKSSELIKWVSIVSEKKNACFCMPQHISDNMAHTSLSHFENINKIY